MLQQDRKGAVKIAIEEWFEENSDAMLVDLGEMIAVKSVFGEAGDGAPYGAEARRALDVSVKILKKLGFDSVIFKDCMAIADLNVPDGAVPEVGLLVHSDVVAATGGGWSSDPYVMEIRGDKIYGRGTTDNKGPAAASMYAMACARDISKKMGIPINGGARLIIGSSEEIGCVDIGRYLEENVPPRKTFSPDANYPIVNVEKGRFTFSFGCRFSKRENISENTFVRELYGGETTNIIPQYAYAVVANISISDTEKTVAEYTKTTGVRLSAEETAGGVKISAYGVSSHASRPSDGNNAQTALIAALASLPLSSCDSTSAIRALAKLFPHGETDGTTIGLKASDEVSGSLTLAFTTIKLTEEGFQAGFDARTPLVSDSMNIVGISENAVNNAGFAVIDSRATKCHVTDGESDFVKTLLGIYEEYTGQKGYCLSLGGTTYVHDIKGGVAFGTEMPGDDHRIHSTDEFIPIDTLIKSGEMFAQAILELT